MTLCSTCCRHPPINRLPPLMQTSCRKERGLLDPAKRDPSERYCSLGDKLTEMGRCGQKTGALCVHIHTRYIYRTTSNYELVWADRCDLYTCPVIARWLDFFFLLSYVAFKSLFFVLFAFSRWLRTSSWYVRGSKSLPPCFSFSACDNPRGLKSTIIPKGSLICIYIPRRCCAVYGGYRSRRAGAELDVVHHAIFHGVCVYSLSALVWLFAWCWCWCLLEAVYIGILAFGSCCYSFWCCCLVRVAACTGVGVLVSVAICSGVAVLLEVLVVPAGVCLAFRQNVSFSYLLLPFLFVLSSLSLRVHFFFSSIFSSVLLRYTIIFDF